MLIAGGLCLVAWLRELVVPMPPMVNKRGLAQGARSKQTTWVVNKGSAPGAGGQVPGRPGQACHSVIDVPDRPIAGRCGKSARRPPKDEFAESTALLLVLPT